MMISNYKVVLFFISQTDLYQLWGGGGLKFCIRFMMRLSWQLMINELHLLPPCRARLLRYEDSTDWLFTSQVTKVKSAIWHSVSTWQTSSSPEPGREHHSVLERQSMKSDILAQTEASSYRVDFQRWFH